AKESQVFCEACHGDASTHLESGDVGQLVGADGFAVWSGSRKAEACLSCHGKNHPTYLLSAHAETDACWTCHETQALHFITGSAVNSGRQSVGGKCTSCHPEVVSQFRLSYRHPLQEGFMTCVSCHQVHQPTPPEGERATCVSCHREQAGPFVFSHAPAEEGCITCHQPHGSAHRSLLSSFGNALCLSCHTQSNFPGVGKVPHNYWLAGGGRCWDCHSQVHGSNVTPDLNPRGRR
ncbi:MAG: cytochrome c3 family protein, partial [Thermoanaerobaculum sp.]